MRDDTVSDKDSGLAERRPRSVVAGASSLERRPALISLRGESLAVPIPLERDSVILGRALDADVRVNDTRASRLHARISIELNEESGGQHWKLTDLGSTNGTKVNGKIVTEAILNEGDKIVIGDHMYRFDLLDEIDREFQQQIHRLLAHDELTDCLQASLFFQNCGMKPHRPRKSHARFAY
jgi:hypothetical protein